MKIYKLLFLTVLSCFALSCSQDIVEDNSIDDSEVRLEASQFDNSHLGLYKGLFSTNDGLTRGTVVVTLLPTNQAVAQITLSSGEVVELTSSRVKLTIDNTVDNLRFTSLGTSSIVASLNFSVEGDGANPAISNVSFDNRDSDILIAKNLSRAPLNTITGTYMRTVGTGSFPISGRTWNIMSVGRDNQTYSTQIWYGGVLYNTVNSSNQTGCSDIGGGFDECDINGSASVSGYPVTWTGTHVYDNFLPNDNVGCSEVSGTWAAPTYGGSSGTFTSDLDCSGLFITNDTCATASVINSDETVVGQTTGSTNTDTPVGCDDNLFGTPTGPGVWFTFTPTISGDVTVDTVGSDFDTQLRIFSGTCGALVCEENDDDSAGSLLSSIDITVTADVTYYIFLGGYNDDVGGYNLNVAGPVPPPPPLTCGDDLVDDGGNPGDYSLDTTTTYLIDAGAGNYAELDFQVFDCEDSWDFIRLYDGDSDASPEITDVNGQVTMDAGGDRVGFTGDAGDFGPNSLEGQIVSSSGQYLTVVFFSDDVFAQEGFFAPITCVALRSDRTAVNQKTSAEFVPARRSSSDYPTKEQVVQRVVKGQIKTAEYYASQQ